MTTVVLITVGYTLAAIAAIVGVWALWRTRSTQDMWPAFGPAMVEALKDAAVLGTGYIMVVGPLENLAFKRLDPTNVTVKRVIIEEVET